MSQTGNGTYQESPLVYHDIQNEQIEDERIPILETVGTETNQDQGNHEKEEINTEKARGTQRMQSLDILRGMTVMLMIVVNNQPAATFWPLLHAEWHGFTLTDCVFPFFLWISGYAIGITFRNVHSMRDKWWNSTSEQREEEKRIKFCWLFPMRQSVYDEIWLWLKIFKRACLLFAIGVSFSFVGHITNPSRTRVMGVLQRISLCYLVVSGVVCLIKWTSIQIALITALHVIYVAATFGIKVPGCAIRGDINDPKCTAQAFIDQRILNRRNIYNGAVYDPEGFLSTLSAITTTYLGVIYFKLSQVGTNKGESFIDKMYRQMTYWLLASSVLFCAAFAIEPYFSLNKHIWSSSFALLTPAIAGSLLSLITFIVDVKKWNRYWIQPFLWVGSNPLVLYVVPTFTAIILLKIPIHWDQRKVTFYSWIYLACFRSWIPDKRFAALLFALFYEAVWLPMAAFMYFKKIYIKL